MDDIDTHFNNLFYDFVEKGGLDREQSEVMSEDFQRMEMMREKSTPQYCAHGATKLTCSTCWLNGFQQNL